MAIPGFQSFMLPLLQFCLDGTEHNLTEAREHLKDVFSLDEKDLKERLPSGRQTRFSNRVNWAKSYLVRAGLLNMQRRGVFILSDQGKKVLDNPPQEITIKYLKQFPEYLEFVRGRNKDKSEGIVQTEATDTETPEETIGDAAERLRMELSRQLIERVKENTFPFFERLVVELLVAMGYGGSFKDAGKAIGKSGDEGIDGIIKEDKLGLDVIYIQAKKWEQPVGRPELQKFVGALQGQRAKKGVFITTGKFSDTAIEYVKKIESKIVLIDGERLIDLMIDHDLGVSVASSIEIKKLDSDYFEDN